MENITEKKKTLKRIENLFGSLPFLKLNFNSKILMCLVLFFFVSANLCADVKMPAFFNDNMLLQRNIPVNIWGWATPDENVTVSFANQKVSTIAGKDGKWLVKLNPLNLNKKAQALVIEGPNKIVIKNVLVGDVWVCSGQSNMEMTVQETINAKDEIATSENPFIRHMKVNNSISLYPKEELLCSKWDIAGPQNTSTFTAVGYYFAREIVKQTGVPVGLINTSWGGTRIEPWTPAEAFRKIPELKNISEQVDLWIPTTETGKKVFLKYIENMKAWISTAEITVKEGRIPAAMPLAPGSTNTQTTPTMIFNNMVNPLVNYGIKGTIWYQGESNGKDGNIYIHKMNALISGWRTCWQQGNFPFYFVQLANFQTSDPNNAAGGERWAYLREAQLKTLSVVPNTGMAVIIDIGETANIHPRDKQDVAIRLAAWALNDVYGIKSVHSGPLFKCFRVEGNKIRISFDHVGSGLVSGVKIGIAPFKASDDKLKWFAIAGTDQKWYWADAIIDGNTVLVSSDKVSEPVAVRYAFAMNPEGANLYNKEGFPASPFRTDNWLRIPKALGQ